MEARQIDRRQLEVRTRKEQVSLYRMTQEENQGEQGGQPLRNERQTGQTQREELNEECLKNLHLLRTCPTLLKILQNGQITTELDDQLVAPINVLS